MYSILKFSNENIIWLKKYPPLKKIGPRICKLCGIVVDRGHYLSANHMMYVLFAKREGEVLGM